MIKVFENKTYVLDNARIAEPNEQVGLNEQKAFESTMTYRVLKAHNRSGDMKNLDIRFDSMGVYDNTYVGILQTARAIGLKEFPIPCVFTNCHNCLNAVGGTLNADVHKYGLSACIKYGGIFVPPHAAVIHQYMREMIINSGDMAIVSDSHTRYGAQGSISIGEGGPELVKTMVGKGYALKYPKVIGVFLSGVLKPWVGPMDVALTLIGKVFKNGFVKNAVLEFIGPGVSTLSMDTRNGIDTMTTETACLSSIWTTDEKTRRYFEIHGRPEGFREMKPGEVALYDGLIELDLSKVEPMIALPFHPSNAYPLAEVIANPKDAMAEIETNAKKVFENNKNIVFDMQSKVRDGKIHVDQGIVAGCCAGSFENIYTMSKMAEYLKRGIGTFGLNIYPASQPIMYDLNRVDALNVLIGYGVRVKSAFCGPCFGAGDTPGNNDLSIRHTTRNFPNREGSNPATGQVASVALMDARSIAATAFNGGVLTSAADCWSDFVMPEYHFNQSIYKNTVYNGFGKAKPEVEMVYGPDIKDWPEMTELTENLLLKVSSVIRDEVTTTDELIPSGETASYRSNPYKISQFTLIRKDPNYVGNASAIQEYEKARIAGDAEKASEYYRVLRSIGIDTPVQTLMKTTGIGSVLYAKRPGDGSAREYAASCQKVLGGLANICIEYATKRYRSNCINWGILPFTNCDDNIQLEVGEYIYLPGIRKAVEDGITEIKAVVIGKDGNKRNLTLELKDVTEAEKRILLAGSLINYYKE
jgi:aconitate hydratase